MKRLILSAAVALLGAAITARAGAVLTTQTFNFTGVCTDCSSTSTASLTVSSGYILGSALSLDNFVSFTYNGTNLLPAFTILPTDLGVSVSGAILNDLPNAETVTVSNNARTFSSDAGGSWFVGSGSANNDFGPRNTWASAAPEPATFGMIGLGLLAAAFLRRRVNQAR